MDGVLSHLVAPTGSTGHVGQPVVRGNDWTSLEPAPLGSWEPSRTVTVVVPAHRPGLPLSSVLAALTAQSYPAHLTEVLVVDDGSDPPMELPELRPAGTRLLRVESSWGPAGARDLGAREASGEVVHWLDSDMVPHRHELEAHLRWHHLLGYAVVLGTKTFVDVHDGFPEPDEVARRIAEDTFGELFAGRWSSPHEWLEEHIARTDRLTANPTMSYLAHVGASTSVCREVYLDTGGMDDTLKLSEDIEQGYRLAQQGCLFVPDPEARSWHLGRSRLMSAMDEVNRYTRPFVADRVPDLRHWRVRGRTYTVPWVEVLVDAAGRPYEEVRHSVSGVLTGNPTDVRVSLVGPWSSLGDHRRSVIEDPDADLRMMHAAFVGDPRTRFVEEAPATAYPATFRLVLPAGWSPKQDTVRRLAREMARKDRGLVSLVLPDGRSCRLERTSAFHRARRIAGPEAGSEAVDALVDEVSRSWWLDGVEEGLTHVSEAPPKTDEVVPGRPDDSASAPSAPSAPSADGADGAPGSRDAALGVLRRAAGPAIRRLRERGRPAGDD